jgi:hypothetical protein
LKYEKLEAQIEVPLFAPIAADLSAAAIPGAAGLQLVSTAAVSLKAGYSDLQAKTRICLGSVRVKILSCL